MLLAFLSQALGLLNTSTAPYDGDGCSLQGLGQGKEDFHCCT